MHCLGSINYCQKRKEKKNERNQDYLYERISLQCEESKPHILSRKEAENKLFKKNR